MKDACSKHETALILAVGEHGVIYSDLANQLESLIKIQTDAEQACQRAVGYFGVKAASEAVDKAEVSLLIVPLIIICFVLIVVCIIQTRLIQNYC